MKKVSYDVCIVGGGPAGMVMGLLLAKVGVKVLVVEAQADFAREYRGEVLQPAFTQMMRQLNLEDYIYSHPHLKLERGQVYHRDKIKGSFALAGLSGEIPFALWMPQTVLLQALYDKASSIPSFTMWFHAPIKKLLRDENRVVGATIDKDGEMIDVEAKVVVGADGRYSMVSRLGQFKHRYDFYENDLIWFTIDNPPQREKHFAAILSENNTYIVLPKYPDQLQCGVFMRREKWQVIKAQGIDAMKEILRDAGSIFTDFAAQTTDFKPFHPLQSRIFYVEQWAQDGCLLIGDAAHCASPAGAIGVSLSVATALIGADVILHGLEKGDTSEATLDRVQAIRGPAMEKVHHFQMRAENTIAANSKWAAKLRFILLPYAFRFGLAQRLISRILVLPGDLPIDKRFRF